MSYTVEVPASAETIDADHVDVTTYNGGARGRLVQISVGRHYVGMTLEEARLLRRVLKVAIKRSLVDYPGAR
jgi:hypothetical protein